MFGRFLLSQFFQPCGSRARLRPSHPSRGHHGPMLSPSIARALLTPTDRGARLMGIGLTLQPLGSARIALNLAARLRLLPVYFRWDWQPFVVPSWSRASGLVDVSDWAPVSTSSSPVSAEEEGTASARTNAIRELGGVFGVPCSPQSWSHYGSYRPASRSSSWYGACGLWTARCSFRLGSVARS